MTGDVRAFDVDDIPQVDIRERIDVVGSDTFKSVMRMHATSVVLVSVQLKDRPHFMTATSFVPVSL